MPKIWKLLINTSQKSCDYDTKFQQACARGIIQENIDTDVNKWEFNK